MEKTYSTPAWLLDGMIESIPGTLELRNRRLSFTAGGRIVFDAPLETVSGVKFPWYYFGGGMKLQAGGQSYRISFVTPDNKFASAIGTEHSLSVTDGRKIGRSWQELLRQL